MTDKKKGIPKPKTKNLTKSQERLLEKSKGEIELLTREIFNYIAERISRLGNQVVDRLLEDFLEELGLDENEWQFDARKRQFTKKDN